MKYTFGTVSVNGLTRKLVLEALSTQRLSCGKNVLALERKFAKLLGCEHAVAVSSGGEALTVALASLYDRGVARGDEVIVPALSFAATGNSVLQAGFKPVFVDIERSTLNINPSLIERAITDRTVALLPVHLMGKPAAMTEIMEIAHDLAVIEDASEAHGSRYNGQPAGSMGDMGCFSLYVAHMITSVEGGMIVTNRDEFPEILRSLRAHGRACVCEVCVLNTASGLCKKRFEEGEDIRFRFDRIGFSCKMNELEAAVGLGCLEDYESILQKRKANYWYLLENFRRFAPRLVTIESNPWEEVGPHAFPFLIQDEHISRGDLVDYLEERGIDCRTLFQSMPTQCKGFSFLGHREGDFPEAEYVGRRGLHVGVHQDLTQAHLDYFLNTVEDFLRSAA